MRKFCLFGFAAFFVLLAGCLTTAKEDSESRENKAIMPENATLFFEFSSGSYTFILPEDGTIKEWIDGKYVDVENVKKGTKLTICQMRTTKIKKDENRRVWLVLKRVSDKESILKKIMVEENPLYFNDGSKGEDEFTTLPLPMGEEFWFRVATPADKQGWMLMDTDRFKEFAYEPIGQND